MLDRQRRSLGQTLTRTLLALTFSGFIALPAQADYPERPIQGVIQWGAGGATDNLARSLSPHVEKALDTRMVLVNRPGGTGVIGMNTVLSQPANGYTLLYGAENPQLYPVMGLADFTYADMTPINVIAQGLVVIAAPADKPWHSLADLMKAAHDAPGTLRMGDTGAGGLPSTLLAMINAVDQLDVRQVTFGGDGPGITAMLGDHIDFMPLNLAAAQQHIASGRLKALAIVADHSIQALPDAEPITTALPQLKPYLPWGPFWTVAVRQETPKEAVDKLSQAYHTAVASDDFQQFLTRNGMQSLNLQGQAAVDFLNHWQSVTAWALDATGGAKVSPATLNIPKP